MNLQFKDIRLHRFIPALLLMAGAYLLFAATFESPWLMDDMPVILNNPAILSPASFYRNSHFLRPLRELSLMIDYKLFGFNSTGYHIQQIFWHGLNAILLFALASRIGLRRSAAWIAALLFMAHPVHVEVVANISHRKDTLALAFALLSLLAYHQSFLDDKRRHLWRIVTAFCIALGFLAKENIIVMPLILWLYETAFIPQDKRLLARHNRFAPLIALFGIAALTTWYFYIWNQWDFRKVVLSAMLKMDNYTQFSQQDYFLMVLKSIAFMVSKLVWPVNLSMEYTYPLPKGWLDPWVSASILLILAVALSLAICCRRSKALFFSMGWLLVFWLPTTNLFWYLSYFAADRYLYAPSAGFCLMFAVLYDSLPRQWSSNAKLIPALGAIAVFAMLTWRQTLVWTNGERFYQHMLQISPGTQAGIIGLSHIYNEQGLPNKALALLDPALQADPLYVDANFYNQAGLVYSKMGNMSTAISYFRKAVKNDRDNFIFYNNLGSSLDDAGRHEEAEQVQRKAIALAPENDQAHYNLGVALYKQGRLKDARDSFAMSLRCNPRNADALYNMSIVLSETGQRQSAIENLGRLRALDPVQANELERQLAVKK